SRPRCWRAGALHALLLAHGAVYHPGGLPRRRSLRRQFTVADRTRQEVVRGGGKVHFPHWPGKAERRPFVSPESSQRQQRTRAGKREEFSRKPVTMPTTCNTF